MRPRPLAFFGPDDWLVEGDEERHNARIAAWDREFASLPWWRRAIFNLIGV